MENIVLLWKCREPLLADLRSEDVLPYLRQEMVLSQSEEEIINHEITTQGKTLKLLTFLQEKLLNDSSGRPLQALSWALRETYPHLADVLNEEHVTDEDIVDYRKTPSPLGYGPVIITNLLTDDEVVHIVQTELMHHYSHHLQYLTPVPWNEAFQVETSHVFTSLKTVNVAMANWASKSLNEMAKDVHSEGLPMEDIFQPQEGGTPPKHILIEGEPGIGKTTFCRKLAYDWSQKLAQFCTLQKYDLVFHLEARNVETTIMDAIFAYLLPDEFTVKKDQLCKTMEKILIQERSLFIIDAYDELPGPNEDLQKLLYGRRFSRSTVIMTTRPTFANPVIKCFDSGFVILGFPYQRRKEFIRKYAAETCLENKLFKSLEDSLFENETLADLSRNPLYLWFLCLLVEDSRGCLPESRTELFLAVVDLLIHKSAIKLGADFDACMQASEALCVIAFKLVLSGKVHIEESDLMQHWNKKNNLSLQLGLLSKEVSPSRLRPKVMYTFTHKTIQEFLAAKHLCSINKEEMIACLVGHKGENLEMILVFLCGLLKGHDDILKVLYKSVICRDLSKSAFNVDGVNNDKASHSAHHLGLQCLGESGEFGGLQQLCQDIIPPCFLYHITLCHYCLQGFVTAHSRRLPPHNPDLVLPGVELEMYQMLDYKLLDAVQRCKQMPSIVFSSVLGIHVLLEYLTKISSARPDMRHLFIYMTSFMNPDMCNSGYDLRELKSAYTSLMSVETLVFQGSTSRLYKGTESIAQGLQMIMDLLCSAIGSNQFRMLGLVEHNISSSTALVLAQRLCMCNTLKKVFLHSIVIDRLSFETLLGALATCNNLSCMSVSCCSEEEQSNKYYVPDEICRVVKKVPLKRLMLTRCCIDLPLMKMLEALLYYKSEIHQLDFSYNQLSPEGIDVVYNIISSAANMSAIGLSHTGISSTNLPGLCQALKKWSNIQKIDLSGNVIGSTEQFITLCQTLNQLPGLTEVVLDNCGIIDSYLTGLILLFHKPTMAVVSLHGNNIGTSQDSARYLISTLDGTKSLVSLKITMARLSLDLVRMLTGALSRNNTMKTLKIKGHPGPGAMDLMRPGAFKTISEYVRTNIPSVKDFSVGFGLIDYQSSVIYNFKHDQWRQECFDTECKG